jgi:hypothetical protein
MVNIDQRQIAAYNAGLAARAGVIQQPRFRSWEAVPNVDGSSTHPIRLPGKISTQ